MSDKPKRNIFSKVVGVGNARWSVVKVWGGDWLAAAPDDSDYPERRYDDRRFDSHAEALIYAIEQAESDAKQKRLVVMAKLNNRNIFNKVLRLENDKWSVVQDWSERWVAAAPLCGDAESWREDRSFYTHKEALAYAIEQADIDATQERLV